MTRVCLARHGPSPGFLTPSTVSSLSGPADSLGPLPLLGFHSRGSFEREGRDALPHPLHPVAVGAPQPRTLRNTRSEAPPTRRHLSPSALVPWPWSQSRRVPFEAHHSRIVAAALASARSLSRFVPRRLGEP
jgi:hypothetical protein